MSAEDFDFLSREELLAGGLAPGRRAGMLLFAIESMTARLVDLSKRATAWHSTAKAAEEREGEFLEALAAGREMPLQPEIQDIERYAANWASLVEEADANLRAALAQAMGRKYTFTQAAVPGIRAALGLDTEPVQRSYQRFYGDPLDAIYAAEIPSPDRLRWTLAGLARSLETLPPFWLAFGLTLPVGPGLLALPIAIADVGALPGVLLLIFFGLVNALTAAALAEAVARSGTTRFGLGYLGQLVSEYLGNAGSVLLTIMLALNSFLVLIVFYFGISGTLEGATSLPAELWIVVLFGVGLYFLTRRSLNTTVASTLVVTATNLVLLLIIMLLALPYVSAANLAYLNFPGVTGQPFDPAILTLVFGVMLSNFFSHLLIANYGKVVLRRDPSARSWIWGCVAAIGFTTLVSCLWILAFNGALPPETLAQETGTALTALAELAGPVVDWLGAIFVVLSLGMACIHVSLGLLFLVEERLPAGGGGRLGKQGRFLLSIAPVVAVFLVAEWLTITGNASFAGLLGYVGVVSLPLLAGIYPVLLLASTRRKGDLVPGLVLRIVGNPVVLVATYLLFLGSIFVYGLFIYDGLVERAVTLLVGLVVLAVTLVMLRRGALDPRAVLELRRDDSPGGVHLFSLAGRGEPVEAQARLVYADVEEAVEAATRPLPAFPALCVALFRLPLQGMQQLKVWSHAITPEWTSEALLATLDVRCAGAPKQFDLAQTGGQAFLPVDHDTCELVLTLADAPAAQDRCPPLGDSLHWGEDFPGSVGK